MDEQTPVIRLDMIEVKNGICKMDFSLDRDVYQGEQRFQPRFQGKPYPFRTCTRFVKDVQREEEVFKRSAFIMEFPLNQLANQNTIDFVLTDSEGRETLLGVSAHGYLGRVTKRVKKSYWCFDHYMVTLHWADQENTDAIQITKTSAGKNFLRELQFLKEILLSPEGSRRMFAVRTMYWLTYPVMSRKKIWITFDKLYKGGDCGEYFYKYMKARKEKGILPVYVINGDAPDYRRLVSEGYRPSVRGSLKQRLQYLNASMIFATHSAVHSFCGFSNWEVSFVQDRIRSVNTCIQHGLSVQDLTHDSNRVVNNNKRYYCASQSEIKNLSQPTYDYDPSVLRLTGIPRYDGLINKDKKQILITPTWRNYIAMPAVMGESRPYNPDFKDTDYYKIYQSLLENEKLIETAKRTGYEVLYLLHPVTSAQIKDYHVTDGIQLKTALEINYEQVLTESSLMVTDYSGVQFDFAYMRKPVVYFHPDELPPHYTNDGFDYETQGFGEICKTEEILVEVLCRYMEQNCQLTEEYKLRQDTFFAFDDRENCRRIFEDALAFSKEAR